MTWLNILPLQVERCQQLVEGAPRQMDTWCLSPYAKPAAHAKQAAHVKTTTHAAHEEERLLRQPLLAIRRTHTSRLPAHNSELTAQVSSC